MHHKTTRIEEMHGAEVSSTLSLLIGATCASCKRMRSSCQSRRSHDTSGAGGGSRVGRINLSDTRVDVVL
jgi:hypothetical protein